MLKRERRQTSIATSVPFEVAAVYKINLYTPLAFSAASLVVALPVPAHAERHALESGQATLRMEAARGRQGRRR